MIFDEASN